MENGKWKMEKGSEVDGREDIFGCRVLPVHHTDIAGTKFLGVVGSCTTYGFTAQSRQHAYEHQLRER